MPLTLHLHSWQYRYAKRSMRLSISAEMSFNAHVRCLSRCSISISALLCTVIWTTYVPITWVSPSRLGSLSAFIGPSERQMIVLQVSRNKALSLKYMVAFSSLCRSGASVLWRCGSIQIFAMYFIATIQAYLSVRTATPRISDVSKDSGITSFRWWRTLQIICMVELQSSGRGISTDCVVAKSLLSLKRGDRRALKTAEASDRITDDTRSFFLWLLVSFEYPER